jgi:two-component system, chemotaxis family, protein-glutamate methylesterase/glutaminase
MSRIRVLVVDDSAFARKVVRESLASSSEIEVIDVARDGLEAVEKVSELRPDVVTLDLVMPNLDGVGVLRAMAGLGAGAPRVVLVSMSTADSDLAVEALALGAVELVHKPTALAIDRLYEMRDELIAAVLAAASARPPPVQPVTSRPVAAARPPSPRARLLVIGASTGGPQALTRVLAALPGDLSTPIAVVLHLPVEYTAAFARRLDELSALDVVEARDRLPLRPGLVAVARGGMHLVIDQSREDLLVRLEAAPLSTPHRPSVDVLFESAARVVGSALVGVVLTGMGSDGLSGARAIRAAGGAVLTEAESSCVVYGMPRAVREADLSSAEAPIDEMAALILSRL